MPWQILHLDAFQEDVAGLAARHGFAAESFDAEVEAAFTDRFKAARVDALLASGVATPSLDRLAGSAYPPSIRLHVLHDLRATAWCFPRQRHVLMVHAFHKSADPRYKRALATHDARLKGYFESFHEFVARKRRN